MFHSLFNSAAISKYLFLFSIPFIFILWSTGITKGTSSFYFYYYLFLSLVFYYIPLYLKICIYLSIYLSICFVSSEISAFCYLLSRTLENKNKKRRILAQNIYVFNTNSFLEGEEIFLSYEKRFYSKTIIKGFSFLWGWGGIGNNCSACYQNLFLYSDLVELKNPDALIKYQNVIISKSLN